MFRYLLIGFSQVMFLISIHGENASPANDWISSPGQWKELYAGDAILLESSDPPHAKGSRYAATAAILIEASVEEVWNVINDQERAPGYLKSLLSSKSLEDHDTYSLLEQEVKVGFHKVKYVVRHMPEPQTSIHFQRVSGDLKEMAGFWRFISVKGSADTRTLLIYQLSLTPDFPVPPFLVKKSLTENLPDTLHAVNDEVLRLRNS
ncbi:MAG: SRPBCC family protein [Verrucomicrobiales bacterium]|nr:SRPBCC family protein [Verrucomicrobiales bacterium]